MVWRRQEVAAAFVVEEELELDDVLDEDAAAGVAVDEEVDVVSGFFGVESPEPLPDFSALTLPERESLR
ncbi:hypothetical protein AB0F81_40915 [Actinoplanes sp. NPDC024001]|uniref:hypothetical protein n=1 Tax=Actinoplanes sp. NPDC024001 TaxID=3154598 RepID=UPI0033E220E5